MNIRHGNIYDSIKSHPVLTGIEAIRERVVPAVQQARIKFDENRPDKFIKQTIANNCSSLSNKLRNIIHTGDCAGYVLLRKQLTDFMRICQQQLKDIPENDTRPLTQLQQDIENCDKAALIQNGIAGLKDLIVQTNYLPRELEGGDRIDNRWTSLENTLLEVRELARETSTLLSEVEQLMDVYYTKCVDGLLLQIEEKEDLTVREGEEAFGHHNAFYGHGRGRVRIVEDPEIARTRLMVDVIGYTSDVVSKKLLERIKEHTNAHPIRVGRMTYDRLSKSCLNWYNIDVPYLKKLKQQLADKSDIESRHRSVIESGSECLKILKPAIQSMVLVRESLTDADDIKFLDEMEELLMNLHLNIIQSCIDIKEGPQQITQRLNRMQGDIQRLCFRNKARVPVWSSWHTNLSNRLPSIIAPRGTSTAPGGAFGKRRHS